jgi:hypothetical protein
VRIPARARYERIKERLGALGARTAHKESGEQVRGRRAAQHDGDRRGAYSRAARPGTAWARQVEYRDEDEPGRADNQPSTG